MPAHRWSSRVISITEGDNHTEGHYLPRGCSLGAIQEETVQNCEKDINNNFTSFMSDSMCSNLFSILSTLFSILSNLSSNRSRAWSIAGLNQAGASAMISQAEVDSQANKID